MRERWNEIDVWPGWYVSNKGRIKNKNGIRKTCPNMQRRRYHYAYHSSSTVRPRAIALHRLVASHFIPNPLNKPCVNHIDNNPENNCASNLEWCTHLENANHAKQQGRLKTARGEQSVRATLTDKKVREIKHLKGRMRYIDIAEKYVVPYSTIAHIMRGSRWAHVSS